MSRAEWTVFVDADVFITLAEIGAVDVLRTLPGSLWMPIPVDQEIVRRPASSVLETVVTGDAGWLQIAAPPPDQYVQYAALHLGRDVDRVTYNGDILLLAHALAAPNALVVTDDKPLRKCCRTLSIPVAGTLAVLVAAVERGALDSTAAKAHLLAVDEVGPRLSASVLRNAERMIDDASEQRPALDEATDDELPGPVE